MTLFVIQYEMSGRTVSGLLKTLPLLMLPLRRYSLASYGSVNFFFNHATFWFVLLKVSSRNVRKAVKSMAPLEHLVGNIVSDYFKANRIGLKVNGVHVDLKIAPLMGFLYFLFDR